MLSVAVLHYYQIIIYNSSGNAIGQSPVAAEVAVKRMMWPKQDKCRKNEFEFKMYFVRKLNSRCILSVLSEIGPSRAIRAAAMLSGPFVPEFAINIKINPDNKS